MKTFKELIEGKQVGIIYHFTDLNSFEKILKSKFKLKDIYKHGYISFSRNSRLEEFGKKGIRITVDGDKLSNKYSIKPFMDLQHDVTRNHGENEEMIKVKKGDSIDIKNSVLAVEHLTKLRLPMDRLEKIRIFLKNKYPLIKYGQYQL